MLPLVLANWLSTLYLRYHYMIDDVAGWATAAIAIAVAAWILRLESAIHERLKRRAAA
jgi:membrane-associated phospholipid phosphatase